MATVTRENIGPLNDKITVTVDKEDYLAPFEKALKQYAKSANIPGFRKGMVPAGIIKKMHGNAVYTEEVLKSIEKGLVDYLQKENLDIFGQPLPDMQNDPASIDMNNPATYSFHFEVGIKPSFELPDLNTVALTRYKIEVPDNMVEEESERLRVRQGKMTEPESVATDEDILNIKLEECDEQGNLIENGIQKDNSLLLKYFNPSFREQLIGKKKDDSLVLQLDKAFDEKERDWLVSDLGLDKEEPAGLEKFFKLTITKIGLVEKRELNEEFFEEVFPGKEIKDEDAFRAAIREIIGASLNQSSRNHFHHELYHALLDNTQIEFPEAFLKKFMEKGGEEEKSTAQVEEEFPDFKNQLKWSLITEKIIKDNALEVTPEEIRNQITQEVLSYFGASGLQGTDMSWINNYVDSMTKNREQVENTYRKVITGKIFEMMETKVTPVEQPISLEDFQKLQEEHQHHHH